MDMEKKVEYVLKAFETLKKIEHLISFPITRCSTCSEDYGDKIDCNVCEIRLIKNEIEKLKSYKEEGGTNE